MRSPVLYRAAQHALGDPYLDGVWLASVDGHAHSEATEDCRSSAVSSRLLSALRVVQKLSRPGQQQQAVLHIQGPGNGVYWVMESHGEGITLCCNLQRAHRTGYTLLSCVRHDLAHAMHSDMSASHEQLWTVLLLQQPGNGQYWVVRGQRLCYSISVCLQFAPDARRVSCPSEMQA